MSPQTPDHDIGGIARQLFERQVAGLDTGTAEALRTRRRSAMPTARSTHPGWLPFGGLVAAGLAIVLWSTTPMPDDAAPPRPPSTLTAVVRDADVARDSEAALAEFEEDPEFYLWLAEAPAAPEDNPVILSGELL